jgi:diguanylate cyclase (GGDEF)-like protein/PAS domain S-box-containing protein
MHWVATNSRTANAGRRWLMPTSARRNGASGHSPEFSRGEPHLYELRAMSLQHDDELLAALMQSFPALLMVFDRNGALSIANRFFETIAGYAPSRWRDLHFADLFADASAHAHWQTALSSRPLQAFDCSEFLTSRNGRRVPLQLSVVRLGEGASLRVAIGASDLRSQRATERHLVRQAYFDGLTRFPNRAGFKQQLALRLAGSFQSEAESLAVVVVDVTRFRVINDAIGYDGGDALLQSLAARLQSRLHEVVIGHMSAGEFAAMFTDVRDECEANHAGQRVLDIFKEPFLVRGQRIALSARAGVALAGSTADPASVLRDADAALFEAKESGEPMRVFDRSMRLASEARLRLDIELRAALAKDELRLVLQPIVNLGNRQVVGFEALVRWAHPTQGELQPSHFMSHAERSGIVPAIDAWALRAALGWLSTVSCNLLCNVNTSAVSLLDADWLAGAVALIDANRDLAGRLRIEITESALLGDAQSATRALDRLIGAGAQIVLDDFGTGYSSLVHLQSFPISGIKVDRSFVARLCSDRRNQTIVAAVIGLASDLGLSVTAEGVETEEQRVCLLEHGCGFAQGYLFGRPIPAADASSAAAQHAHGAHQ